MYYLLLDGVLTPKAYEHYTAVLRKFPFPLG